VLLPMRHEEKYIIDYPQYLKIKARAAGAMQADKNSAEGSYLITSLYYDDRMDSALDEKLDGVRVHTKYRVRTYNSSDSFVRLEKKIKIGIMTEKLSAKITPQDIQSLSTPSFDLTSFNGDLATLATDMRARGLMPAVTVRYRRDAFVYPDTNTRLTFDTEIEALPPNSEYLFNGFGAGVPALPRGSVIMELKYDTHLPVFIRKLCACSCQQLSVSKYALCRMAWH